MPQPELLMNGPRRRRENGAAPSPRLTHPYVRDYGRLRRATWAEALDRVADALRDTLAKRGPSGIGIFSCSKATNEVNFLAQKFARAALGTNNIDSCNRT